MSSGGGVSVLHPLFDEFVLVSIKKDTYTPYVYSMYPPNTTPNPNVALFCFPEDIDANTFTPKKTTPSNSNSVVRGSQNGKNSGNSFFFVLTDGEGKQQYGFTRRVCLDAEEVSIPHCLCILSHWQWPTTFAQLLEIIDSKLHKVQQLYPCVSYDYISKEVIVSIHSILFEAQNYGLPLPGESLTLDNYYTLTRPKEDDATKGIGEGTDESFYPLLECLSPLKVYYLFVSLLCERRIIAVSSNLSRISKCLAAVISMLKPFQWQHIFIPVLPRPLLDYCCAPMPFLTGLHSSLMLPLQMLPINEVVFVDLDRDQVGILPEDMEILPSSHTQPLKSAFESALSLIQGKAATSLGARRVVVDAIKMFFVRLLGPYRRFFFKDPEGRITWEKQGFLNSQHKSIRNFLQVFCGSQMFERFLAEREDYYSHPIPGPGAFDRAVAQWEASHPETPQLGGSIKDLAVGKLRDYSASLNSFKERVQEGKRVLKEKVDKSSYTTGNATTKSSGASILGGSNEQKGHDTDELISNHTPLNSTPNNLTPNINPTPPKRPLPSLPPTLLERDIFPADDMPSNNNTQYTNSYHNNNNNNNTHNNHNTNNHNNNFGSPHHNHHTNNHHKISAKSIPQKPLPQTPHNKGNISSMSLIDWDVKFDPTTDPPPKIVVNPFNPFDDDDNVSSNGLPPPILPPPPRNSNSVSKTPHYFPNSNSNSNSVTQQYSQNANTTPFSHTYTQGNNSTQFITPSTTPPSTFNPFFDPQLTQRPLSGTVPALPSNPFIQPTFSNNHSSSVEGATNNIRSSAYYHSFTLAGPDLSLDFATNDDNFETQQVPTVPKASPIPQDFDWFSSDNSPQLPATYHTPVFANNTPPRPTPIFTNVATNEKLRSSGGDDDFNSFFASRSVTKG